MKIAKLFIVMLIAMLAFSFALATASAVSEAINEKKNKGIMIESKEKKVNYKITWNANGGKLGSKKTTVTSVKKGSKIAKLPATPKRSGYTFLGWYSKKTGGSKINTNTKPINSVTYFAQWIKKSSRSNIDSKLVGRWQHTNIGSYIKDEYSFRADGTFIFIIGLTSAKSGNYKVSGGKISFTNISWTSNGKKKSYPNTVAEYRFEMSYGEECLNIVKLDYPQYNYLSLNGSAGGVWGRWYRV